MIYIMESGIGLYKVGYSSCPEQRKQSLEITMGLTINLIAKFNSVHDSQTERLCHKYLNRFLVFGEWFSCDESTVKAVVRFCCNEARKIKIAESIYEIKKLEGRISDHSCLIRMKRHSIKVLMKSIRGTLK